MRLREDTACDPRGQRERRGQGESDAGSSRSLTPLRDRVASVPVLGFTRPAADQSHDSKGPVNAKPTLLLQPSEAAVTQAAAAIYPRTSRRARSRRGSKRSGCSGRFARRCGSARDRRGRPQRRRDELARHTTSTTSSDRYPLPVRTAPFRALPRRASRKTGASPEKRPPRLCFAPTVVCPASYPSRLPVARACR